MLLKDIINAALKVNDKTTFITKVYYETDNIGRIQRMKKFKFHFSNIHFLDDRYTRIIRINVCVNPPFGCNVNVCSFFRCQQETMASSMLTIHVSVKVVTFLGKRLIFDTADEMIFKDDEIHVDDLSAHCWCSMH